MDQVNTIVYADISTPYPPAEITAKQGDAGSRTLEVRLTQAGQPYAISSGVTARIYIRKPDKTIVYNNATITNAILGYVTVELTSQALAAAGRAQCEIMLYAGQDLLTSIPFTLHIIRQVHDDSAVESSNEFGALADALNEVASLTPEGVVAENSINTIHLKDGSVTTPKIANGAVTSEKLGIGGVTTENIADGAVTADKLANVYTKAEHPDVPVDFNTLTTPGFYAVSATWDNPEDRYTNGPDIAYYGDGGNYDRSLSVWVVPGGYGTHGNDEVYYDGLMQVAISIPYKKTWIRRQTVPWDQPESEPAWSAWEETPANVLPYLENQTDPDTLQTPGLYSIGANKYLVIPHNDSRITLCQIRITTHTSGEIDFAYRYNDTWSGDDAWYDWQELGGGIPDGSITADKIADAAVTSDKLAADVIPSELPADKLLAGAGGRAMQATPYAVRTTESILRVTKDTAGMPPKTIGVPLLPSYVGDTPCSLYFEARAVAGSKASLNPAGNADDGFIGSWTTSGAINDGEWGSFSVEDKTGFTGLSILLSSDQAASVDFKNIRVVDAAGIDYVDHVAFEAKGAVTEDFPDTPETDATDIPTVAGVKAMLAELEARVAALEGGGA